MSTFLLIAALILVLGLAGIAFLAAAARQLPLNPVDNLPDSLPIPRWTTAQKQYFRASVGLQRLYADVTSYQDGDEGLGFCSNGADSGDARPEDAYSKKLRLNAEHEAELAVKRAHKSAYHKAWYQLNKEPRKAQVKARAQAIRKVARNDAANQARRVAQLAYWTPERKAEQSRLTVERMAAKRPQPVIIAPAPALVCSREEPTYTYGQRALA